MVGEAKHNNNKNSVKIGAYSWAFVETNKQIKIQTTYILLGKNALNNVNRFTRIARSKIGGFKEVKMELPKVYLYDNIFIYFCS